MAYDKSRFDEIANMGVGELIHTMLVEFDRRVVENEGAFAAVQSPAYFWAYERLNELLPAPRQAHDNEGNSD